MRGLALNPTVDLRKSHGAWFKRLDGGHPAGGIACVESSRSAGGVARLNGMVAGLFALLGVARLASHPIDTVAMPVLGAGDQRFDPARALDVLVPAARQALEELVALRTICFVAHTEEIAARMSQALDDHLGRTDLERRSLPDDAVTRALRDDLLACIVAVSPRASRGLASVLGEVRFAFTAAEAPRTLEVAVLGRRLAEATSDLLLGKCAARVDLLNRIEKLRDKRVAPWIVSYLHMLRVLGNEAAHEKDLPERVPVRPGDGDAKTLLFCMVRILEFLRDHPKAVTDGGALP